MGDIQNARSRYYTSMVNASENKRCSRCTFLVNNALKENRNKKTSNINDDRISVDSKTIKDNRDCSSLKEAWECDSQG
ncbi:hypothetical protein WN55_04095 [Dufourea novaeangliae]|uniref:Uncharacterized protein n=1 Tax=Dufourea novaeangliae TaxID=178035 RepID=A0A154PKD4_DUFNO|nr:hypothetical protein WN55_04095 [Dufourea novaeangliae]